MDDRPEGKWPPRARLIQPGAEPLQARLVAAPMTPFPKLLGKAVSATLRYPSLGLALGAAVLLSRAGWAVGLLLGIQALLGEIEMPTAAALGLGLCAALLAFVIELAVWAGGIPVLAERIRGGPSQPFSIAFVRGLENIFATMLGLGATRIIAWLIFQFAVAGLIVCCLFVLIASPALLALALPFFLIFVAGDLLWRILAWIAIARAGSLGESYLPALFAGLRQFFRRPLAHVLTWWGANLAISLAGGGVAVLVAAGLGAMSALGASLLALVSSLLVGMILLAVMSIYTALSLDSAPPRARGSP